MAANNSNGAVPTSLVITANNGHNPTYPNLSTRLSGANSQFERQSQELIRILFDNVQSVSQRVGNTVDTINNVTTMITKFAGGGGGGGNNGNGNEVYVAFGPHASRLGSNDVVLWIETDRSESQYYFDGSQWNIVAAQWSGSFEDRYGDLGIPDAGGFWTETSRNNIVATPPYLQFQWNGNAWLYQSGMVARNQNQLAVLAATLTANDAGLMVNVQDCVHELQWGGSNNNFGWNWGPGGDDGVTDIRTKAVAPSSNSAWQLCDGSNTSYLASNGNLIPFTTPNLTSNNGSYTKFGANYNGTVIPANSPTFNGTAAPVTGSVAANFTGIAGNITGNVNSTFTGTPGNIAGNIVSTFTGTTGNLNGTVTITVQPFGSITATGSSAVNVVPAGATQVAQQAHAHTFVGTSLNYSGNVSAGSYTPAGNVNSTFAGGTYTPTGNVNSTFTGDPFTPAGNIAATFTGNNFTPAGNISNNSEPAHLIALPYFRR